MTFDLKPLFFCLSLLAALTARAQEGGPPMFTDDARVADFKEWELNNFFHINRNGTWSFSAVDIDLNYGAAPHLQLTLDIPAFIRFEEGGFSEVTLDPILIGGKYRFLDEEKYFVSAAVFPKIALNKTRGFLLPLFLEKTIGRFLIGTGQSFFFGAHGDNHSEHGLLLGFKPTAATDLMIEYFNVRQYGNLHESSGYLHLGFRRQLSESFIFMAALGTQVRTPDGVQREGFLSSIGLKSLF